jgi:3-deoxy-D-manno-octulosonate 8-phosphate phosphatase (KDO 8-P phosphatase)
MWNFVERRGLALTEVAFMGDDVNVLAGLAAAPATAHDSVRRAADHVSALPGGQGAVRELVDLVLATKTS